MQALFHRYFSIQGRSIKHLPERWRDFKSDPTTEDIEVFISDLNQMLHHPNHSNTAVLSIFKTYMPGDIYVTLYPVQELDVAVAMVKVICTKKPEPRAATGTTHFLCIAH